MPGPLTADLSAPLVEGCVPGEPVEWQPLHRPDLDKLDALYALAYEGLECHIERNPDGTTEPGASD